MSSEPSAATEGSRGIVYVAMGERFVREAAVSATSARRHVGVEITVFTDRPDVARATGAFERIVELVQSGRTAHRDKLVALRQSPYDRTLYLDTDTYVAAPLDGFWELLDHFDLAATGDRGYRDEFPTGTGVPGTYKELNTGVLLLRRSDAVGRVLADALDEYDRVVTRLAPGERVTFYDQAALRLALYSSPLRVAPLPDEDNCRFATYGKLNGPVRIVHGRQRRAAHTAANLQRVVDRLNATTAPRVFVAGRTWALVPQRLLITDKYRPERLRPYRRLEPAPVAAAVVARLRSIARRLTRTRRTR